MNIQKYILLLASSLFAFYPTYGAFTAGNAQDPQGDTALHAAADPNNPLDLEYIQGLTEIAEEGNVQGVREKIIFIKNCYSRPVSVKMLTQALHPFLKRESICLIPSRCLALQNPKAIEEKVLCKLLVMNWARGVKLTRAIHDKSDFLDLICNYFYCPDCHIVQAFMQNGANPYRSIGDKTLFQLLESKQEKATGPMVKFLMSKYSSNIKNSPNSDTPLHYSLVHKK